MLLVRHPGRAIEILAKINTPNSLESTYFDFIICNEVHIE